MTTKDLTEQLAKECDAAQEWMRTPDFADKFSMNDVVEWMNNRPSHTLYRSAAMLRKLHSQLDEQLAENERLRGAVDYILDGMGIGGPDYKVDLDDDYLDAANSKWVRQVLVRLAEAMQASKES